MKKNGRFPYKYNFLTESQSIVDSSANGLTMWKIAKGQTLEDIEAMDL